MVDKQAKIFHFPILSHLSINISWKNGKLHGITALEISFLTSNQLLVNINQLFETLEKKKSFWLRLGHTRVTHSYLLLGEEQPQCVGCDAPFTVRHFLLECGDFAQVRNNCFHVDNMKELFQDIHIDSIMKFLRQINLFKKN